MSQGRQSESWHGGGIASDHGCPLSFPQAPAKKKGAIQPAPLFAGA
jgi:hypothetical protein